MIESLTTDLSRIHGAFVIGRNTAFAYKGRSPDVRLDLRLWDADAGKTIRVRAPQTITPASFERFLQAFRLLVRVEEPAPGEPDG